MYYTVLAPTRLECVRFQFYVIFSVILHAMDNHNDPDIILDPTRRIKYNMYTQTVSLVQTLTSKDYAVDMLSLLK